MRLEAKAELDPLAFRVLQAKMEVPVPRVLWEMQVPKVLVVSWALLAPLGPREVLGNLASKAQGEM